MIIPILIGIILLVKNPKGLGSLKVSSFKKVYINNKLNPNLKLSPNKNQKGVYILRKNGKIVYIGYSGSNLYKTFTRHFQSWNDPRQVRITFNKNDRVSARIVYTSTAKQAWNLEKALIKKYKPTENPQQYEAAPITTGQEEIYEAFKNVDRADEF